MKKLLSAVCAVVLAVALAVPAFAASVTKSDIIAELKAGVTVGNSVKQIPDKFIKLASDFLNANDLTDEELSFAMSELKSAREIWAATGQTEFKDIPANIRTQLINKAIAAASKVGATLTFDGKTIKVVDRNGRTYTVLAKDNPIKDTGAEMDYTMPVLLSVAVVAALGGAYVFARKKQLFTGC